LDDALASMPPNLRRAILLREWQGLSYAEIAETLGLSHSAVETLIFRARRHLAQALERNVKQPARKIASALNLGPLAGAFRDLFARGGAAQLATGAVVAVGVAGGGFAISYTLGATSAADASSPSAAGVVGSSQAPSGDGGSSRRGGFVALPGTPLLVPTQAGAADSTSTGSAPSGEPGDPGSGGSATAAPQEPTAGTPIAGPGAAPPPQAPEVPGVVPNPALPTAEAPSPPQTSGGGAATGDAPTLPTLTTPTVTAPTVPTVTTPTVDTPTLPTVTTPTVDTLTLPTVTTPTLTTPTLTT